LDGPPAPALLRFLLLAFDGRTAGVLTWNRRPDCLAVGTELPPPPHYTPTCRFMFSPGPTADPRTVTTPYTLSDDLPVVRYPLYPQTWRSHRFLTTTYLPARTAPPPDEHGPGRWFRPVSLTTNYTAGACSISHCRFRSTYPGRDRPLRTQHLRLRHCRYKDAIRLARACCVYTVNTDAHTLRRCNRPACLCTTAHFAERTGVGCLPRPTQRDLNTTVG